MMLATFSTEVENVVATIRMNLPYILMMAGTLYVIHIFNWFVSYKLNRFGIVPRTLRGLPGIIFSPFLHGDFNHLFFNSIPFVILASMLSLYGWPVFMYVSVVIILLGGFATWLLARRGSHIGASALIMGYWSYLLVVAYYQPSWLSIVLAVVCVYYFGSFLFNVFPRSAKSSWEGHLFGLLAGLVAAYTSPYFLVWRTNLLAGHAG
jgi:membrane associated rhomboid family serine protease